MQWLLNFIMATKQMEKPLALTKDMVEVRIGQLQSTQYGYYANLLLYQNPNATFEALDKTFGSLGWNREHIAIGSDVYCKITVKDPNGNEVYRMDVGSAGDFEPEKSRATDGFKRAAMNFIPAFRSLRKSPKIRIKLADKEVIEGNNGRLKCYTGFAVASLSFDDEKQCFTDLVIVDEDGVKRWDLKEKVATVKDAPHIAEASSSVKKVQGNTSSAENVCVECGKQISPKVLSFSMSKYKRALCMDCQKNAKVAA